MDTPDTPPTPRLTTFRCTDLSAAAFCLLKGVKLLNVEKGELGQLSVFVFEPGGARVAQAYFDGAEAVCKDYSLAVLAAKRALFQERNR